MQEFQTRSQWIMISGQLPDLDQAWNFVQDPSCGATNLFTGTTRNHHEGKKVTSLFYDCYEEMALRESKILLDDIKRKYNLTKALLFHKTGDAPIGEISLVTALSAPHRGPVLEATEELIDQLKQEIPVWKKESFEGGDLWKEEQ